MRRIVLLALAAVLLAPLSAMAQATPVAELTLLQLMPRSDQFEGQWTARHYVPRAASDDYFSDGYGSYFGGPAGMRVQILIMKNETDRASINDAWDALSGWFTQVVINDEFNIDYSRAAELDALPLPNGISDAKRSDGVGDFFSYPICVGIYAIEPNIMIYTLVQGRVGFHSGLATELNTCDDIAAFIAVHWGG